MTWIELEVFAEFCLIDSTLPFREYSAADAGGEGMDSSKLLNHRDLFESPSFLTSAPENIGKEISR